MVTSKDVLFLQVGTVLCAKDAKDAIEFGAKFLMSPAVVKVYGWSLSNNIAYQVFDL